LHAANVYRPTMDRKASSGLRWPLPLCETGGTVSH
jgi:hypothetical protein